MRCLLLVQELQHTVYHACDAVEYLVGLGVGHVGGRSHHTVLDIDVHLVDLGNRGGAETRNK